MINIKKSFDISCSLLGLLILCPVILFVSILIRLKLGSPIIFKQQRPGLHGKPFYIYKFRSMTNETDEYGELLPNHMRLTKFGKILRKTSLDELPQLLNVLKGDISLVGPRPLLMNYLDLYTPEQSKRNNVRPGITGWAQVNGRNAISWDEKFKLDVWYVENQSFLLDMKILFLTLKKVIISEGVNSSSEVTMERFKGNGE